MIQQPPSQESPPESSSQDSSFVMPAPPPADETPAAMMVRIVRRIVVSVIGVTVILAGIVMLVAPGPGLLTIAVGIGILGTEFVWAARVYRRIKKGATTVKDALMPTFFGWFGKKPPAENRSAAVCPMCGRRPSADTKLCPGCGEKVPQRGVL